MAAQANLTVDGGIRHSGSQMEPQRLRARTGSNARGDADDRVRHGSAAARSALLTVCRGCIGTLQSAEYSIGRSFFTFGL